MERYENQKNNMTRETSRLEAFSDGVFAIAITILILEIKVPNHTELQSGLFNALMEKWPSYLSFFIGFFTILVCWINHHFLFERIYINKHSLILANSFNLFLVSFVAFPTAILAQSFIEGDLQLAVQLFGIGYILMPCSYRILSAFVNNDNTVPYSSEEKSLKKAIKRIYEIAIVHTIVTFIISFYSVPVSLFLYVILFSMFLFPATYSKLVMKFQDN